jgi:VIT1/CCC1 family predicted Fe2+/Mn2+ transporter
MRNDLRSSLADLKEAHTADAVARRLAGPSGDSYLRDFVYGAIDGAVTTFAVVSGVAGAELPAGIVLILGAANLVGDGFSMAASNYLGTRAEQQQRDHARRIEEREIELYPEGEREEVRQILATKGFEGELLDRAIEVMTADRARWVDLMLQEELGLSLAGSNPLHAAGMTFLAFITVGLIPLIPFIAQEIGIIGAHGVFAMSALLTGVAFFGVGAAKARFVERSAILSGLETFAVGGAAAGLAYLVGLVLKSIV